MTMTKRQERKKRAAAKVAEYRDHFNKWYIGAKQKTALLEEQFQRELHQLCLTNPQEKQLIIRGANEFAAKKGL